MDIFDQIILFKNCNKKMARVDISKNGFRIRALQCPQCGEQILHPEDKAEFDKFSSLKQRSFQVKLRLVGNSYAVSIPREIIDFQNEVEAEFQKARKMHENMARNMHENMVTVMMEEMNKIALCFNQNIHHDVKKDNNINKPKEKTNGIKIIRINKKSSQ
jgi:hypothetical protein